MNTRTQTLRRIAAPMAAVAALLIATDGLARKPFTAEEQKVMDEKLATAAKRGYDLWYGGRADMANNGLACANCHPDTAATNAHTFPKFMPQFDRVVGYREMVNWCIENPQGGKPLAATDADLVALEAYSFWLHNGVPIQTGLQSKQTAPPTPKSARGMNVKGTGIGYDK